MSYIFSSNGTNRMFQQLDSMLVNLPNSAGGDDTSYGILTRTGGSTPEYSWRTEGFSLGIPLAITYNVTNDIQFQYSNEKLRSTGTASCAWDPARPLEVATYLIKVKLRLFIENIDRLIDNPDAELLQTGSVSNDDFVRIKNNQYFIKVNLGSATVLAEGVYDSLNAFQSFESTAIVNIQSTTPTISFTTNLGSPFGVQLLNYQNDIQEFKICCCELILLKLELNS